MAYAGPKTANLSSVAFGTNTTYDALEIISITFDGISLASFLTSHLGTTGYNTYVSGDLKDGGTVTIEFYVNTDLVPEPTITPATGIVETVTITNSITDGTNTTAPTIAAKMIIENLTFGGSNDDVMKGTYTLKIADDITFTDSSA